MIFMSRPDSEKFAELLRRGDEIRKLVDVLIDSEAVSVIPEPLEPELYVDNRLYHIFSANHRILVNYNKLTAAVYDAGYRKIEEKGE